MFTGIIRTTAKVEKAKRNKGSLFMTIQTPKRWKLSPGDSIATDGVCLTVVDVNKNHYTCELMPETLKKTYFGVQVPQRVNLEPSLRFSDRLGGHLVLGHIDAVGRIQQIETLSSSKNYKISCPTEFTKLVAQKGSIAVDGVSLTVVSVGKNWFSVSLVDYTLKNTTIGEKQANDFVNLEFDIIAKYLNRLIN